MAGCFSPPLLASAHALADLQPVIISTRAGREKRISLPRRLAKVVFVTATAASCAPSETPRDVKPPPSSSAVTNVVKAAADSSKPTQRDTAADLAAAQAGAPPSDTTPISLLPKRFIPDVPGWLGLSMRFLIPDTTPTGERGPTINGLGIFPFDTAWKHVGRGTALTLISDSGTATVFPDGITGSDGYAGNETVLKIRPSETIAARWIVPQSEHAQVQILPVHDSLSEDRLTRIWSAGGAQIRLKRVNRTSARMVAEFNGHSTARSFSIGINPSADSSMGVGDQTDSVLDLKEGWMVPSVYAALRFGANGPIVMIFSESGYECMNTRVVVFRDSGSEWIEEPHFTGDCTR